MRRGVLWWRGVPRSWRRGAVVGAVLALVASVFVTVQVVTSAPVSAAATVPAPAGSWPFSEGSGTTTADSSGNGQTGTLGSGVTWTGPEVGAHSIATNGTSAGAVTVSGPVVNTSLSFTVSAWVYVNALGGANQTFVSINGLVSPVSNTVSGFFLQFLGGVDKFDMVVPTSDSTSTGSAQALSTTLVSAGTWYHLVGVDNVSAGTVSLYVNGALQGTPVASTTPWQATGNTMIGQGMYNGNPTDFVSGKIDDVALYSSALTTAQIATLNQPTIATGYTTSCMINSGNAYCWGDNSTGALGNNSTVNSSVPVPVYTGGVLSGVTLIQIAVGSNFACALSSAGAEYCWGADTNGQLGNGSTTESNVPVLVSGGLTFTQIDTGAIFACGLTSAGAAYCWGDDTQGQLGNGTTTGTPQTTPAAVTTTGTPLSGVTLTQISLGTSSACALSSGGAAYCWGKNNDGQLGNGTTTTPQPTATAVTTSGTPLSGVTLTQISDALGGNQACALGSTGAAYCWGLNSNGQLGNNSTTQSTTAVAVTTSGVLSGVTLTQVHSGKDQTCALSNAGTAYCWGGNTDGDLGINSTTQSLVPVAVNTSGVLAGKTVTQLGTSANFLTCALDSFGAAYCWGLNNLGQAGNPDTTVNNNPMGYFPVPVAVSVSQASAITAGYTHSCLLFSGKAYCWGDNTYGELGNGTTLSSTAPVAVSAGAIPTGTVLVQLTVGNGFTCALASTGAVYCWGLGTSGQLGNNLGTTSSSPVAVYTSGVLSGTVTQVSAGASSACALTSAGKAYCWGLGTSGQLGNNLGTTSSSPVAVYTSGVLSGTVTQVSAGGSAACALTSTGAAYCWGQGTSGQLGNGGTTASNQPVTVSAGGVAYSAISAGGAFACALSAAGAAYCWGDDTYGELGNNTTTTTPQTTPVAVSQGAMPTGTTLTQVSAGYDHACALSGAGAAYCWGLGTSGQLGDNSTATSSVPAAVYTAGVISGRTMTQISAGQYHTCAADTLNGDYCWGLNSSGQVGRADTATNFDTPVTVEASKPDLVTTGSTHSCMIRSGKAYCWGANTYGQLGNNSTASSSVPVAVYTGGALAGVTLIQIVAGDGYTCALSSNGTAYCWGYNTDGELGNNSTANTSAPVAVTTSGVLSGQILTQITAGQYAACGLSAAGAAYCWGQNTSGQLGNNSTTSSSVPVTVSTSGIAVTAIDAGGQFACALSSAGAAYCWGANAAGQLGNSTTTASSVPVLVNMSGVPGAFLVNITTGFNHVCVINAGATITYYCWGDDTYGELGNSTTTTTPQSTPVLVTTTTGVLTGKTVAQIIAGDQSTCALDSTGAAYCWGNNNDGQVGDNTTTTRNAAVAVTATGVLSGKNVTQISPGQNDTCALDSTGAAYCWGTNTTGQLGNPATLANTTGYFPVPVAVTSEPTAITAGYTHSCLVRNGKGYCWGDNTYGELGNGTSTSTPQSTRVLVSGGHTFTQISAGQNFTCALDTAGNAYCWGNDGIANSEPNDLGNGSTSGTAQTTPVLVSGGLTFTQISAGSDFACALTSAGKAYCWGNNHSGQVGNNGTSLAATPQTVYTSGVLTGTVVQISAGTTYACALESTGAAYCWGLGTNGQLGNGTTTTQQTTPVTVTATSAPLSGVVLTSIAAGGTTTCAVGTGGGAYCWGAGGSGQLGNTTNTLTQTTAVAVTTTGVLAGVPLTQITSGTSFACALGNTGAAYCWGLGTTGQLGNNQSPSSSNVAVAVTTSAIMSQISSGQLATCTQDTTGAFYCWGGNSSGQLGDTTTTQRNVPVGVASIIPGAPTGVSATPGNTTATISWTAPASLGTGTLTGYTATATAASSTFYCSTTSATTCVITGLSDGTTYTVTVATNTTDGSSPASSAVTVEPVGPLTLTSPTSLTWASAGNGSNLSVVDTNSGDQQLTAADLTGSGAGWHVTVSATTFTTGTHTLPTTVALDFTGSTSSLASAAPTATCVSTCTLPTDTTTYPVAISTATSSPPTYTVYDTSAGTGEGTMTIGGSTATNPIGWWINVPASAYTGSYTSTLSLAVVSGP